MSEASSRIMAADAHARRTLSIRARNVADDIDAGKTPEAEEIGALAMACVDQLFFFADAKKRLEKLGVYVDHVSLCPSLKVRAQPSGPTRKELRPARRYRKRPRDDS